MAPANDVEDQSSMIAYALFDTAIGRCGVAWGERGINAVQLPQPSDAQTVRRLQQRCGMIAAASPPADIAKAIGAMTALLCGEKRDLSEIVLDLADFSDFNRSVYDIARTIPTGETRSYGDIARCLGDIALARDVGQALGRNPCAIVVPCHRVLAGRRETGRLFRQWRRADQTEDAANRRRRGQSHAIAVRLELSCIDDTRIRSSSRGAAATGDLLVAGGPRLEGCDKHVMVRDGR